MDKFHFFNIFFLGTNASNAYIQVRNKQVTYLDIEEAKQIIIKKHNLNIQPKEMTPSCVSYLGYMTAEEFYHTRSSVGPSLRTKN